MNAFFFGQQSGCHHGASQERSAKPNKNTKKYEINAKLPPCESL